MPRPYEALLAAFSLASVVVLGLDRVGWLLWTGLEGSLPLGLYPLYSFAAASGWLLGNLYARRLATRKVGFRAVLLAFYWMVPIGPFFLLRAMAPIEAQSAAPLVPWFCVGIVTVLFFVPVSLRPRTLVRKPRIGSAAGHERDQRSSTKHDPKNPGAE